MSIENLGFILMFCMAPAGLLRARAEGKPLIFWVTATASLIMLLATLAAKFHLIAMPIVEFILVTTLLALSLILTAALRASKLQ